MNMQPVAFKVYPNDGVFEICVAYDCNVPDPSLSLGLQLVLNDTQVDTGTNNVISSTGIADFQLMEVTDADGDGKIDPWITPLSLNSTDPTRASLSSTMYALGCDTGCAPRFSNHFEFDDLPYGPDTIGIRLRVDQSLTNVSMTSPFETYPQPMGGLTLDLEIRAAQPNDGYSHSLTNLGVTFLVSAFEDDKPVTNVTVSTPSFGDTMYLTRIHVRNG